MAWRPRQAPSPESSRGPLGVLAKPQVPSPRGALLASPPSPKSRVLEGPSWRPRQAPSPESSRGPLGVLAKPQVPSPRGALLASSPSPKSRVLEGPSWRPRQAPSPESSRGPLGVSLPAPEGPCTRGAPRSVFGSRPYSARTRAATKKARRRGNRRRALMPVACGDRQLTGGLRPTDFPGIPGLRRARRRLRLSRFLLFNGSPCVPLRATMQEVYPFPRAVVN